MKFILLSSILFFLTIMESSESYRILCLFPMQSKSHFIMFDALMKGLARKGHQVDVISTFPRKKPYPNYTDIIELPLPTLQLVNNLSYENFELWSNDIVHFLATSMGNNVCKNLGHPELQKLIHNPPNDPPYDLLITEYFTTSCYLAVGHRLKIPTIGVSTTMLYPWHNSVIANPQNVAFVSNNFLNYISPMNFWQRFHNTVSTAANDLYFRYHIRAQDDIIKKYLGDDAPTVREVERDVALILSNSHISVDGARPLVSAVIEVGGLHVEDNDDIELSRDLKGWMDDSKDGFIYFTFGSMVKIESFPKETIRAFYKSLEKIAPVRVLMKIPNPNELPPGLPKNIRTFKWAPQYNVLIHKNIKAFITHGGLMGTQEAIYCGVPMIGIPLFVDQFINVDRYVSKKIAVKLNYRNITEENMDDALNEILNNPVYKNSMVKLSAKFRDRPMSPLDTATWWIEYVARRGNKVLRSPAMDLAWWQIELLDVYVVLLLIAAFAIFLAIALARFLLKIFLTFTGPKVTLGKKLK